MTEWLRVTKEHPCVICQRPDWCTFSSDGITAACMRVQSNRKLGNGAWAHKVDSGPIPFEAPKPVKKLSPEQVERKYEMWECEGLPELGELLGVSIRSLHRLRAGFNGVAWTFPMWDWPNMIGVRYRYPNGKKLTMKGTSNGLFVPTGLRVEGPLLLPEGPTDTAAALDLGFDAIGRPSCNGGVELIQGHLTRNRWHVVVVADNDKPKKDGRRPGQEGAAIVARAILSFTKSVTIIRPPKHKDLRDWLHAGARKADIERLIKNTRTVYNR